MASWYRRSSRFIIDAFRRHNLKITAAPRSPLQKSFSTITFSHGSSSHFCQPLLRSFVLKNAFKNGQRYKTPFLDGSKRFFHNVDANNKLLEHFKPRGFKHWIQNPRNLLRIGLWGSLGSGVLTGAYYWNLERVPFTNRSHLVLLPTSLEKKIGQSNIDRDMKSEHEGKVLGPLHPLSIRVQKIGQKIVEAALKELKKEVLSSHEEEIPIIRRMMSLFKKLGKRDSIIADLEGFKWEFIVVDEPYRVNAYCYSGGKIVVFSGLLNSCREDAEIAVTIGHEVGHVVARHSAEGLSNLPWLIILELFLYDNSNVYLVKTISKFLIKLPYSRRMELEADYIGLILMASAGYDPRVAPHVRGKRERSSSPSDDYVSTHPCGKTRAQLLSQPQVMEEALSIYREVQAQGGA